MFKSLLAFCLSRRPIVVLGLVLFTGAGIIAFKMLNIEAYPNPTPVILEITAQAPGLSAEEMERYYTLPMEIGLYTTPGIDVVRSTSFYGLSFVRVSFKYGVDYNFAYAQASVAMQQNVSLPGGLVPTIQANSSTGEIYRYQVIGPPPLWHHQSAHGAGLDRGAPPVDHPRRRRRQQLGRPHQGVPSRGGPA